MNFIKSDRYLSLERTIDKYLGGILALFLALFYRRKSNNDPILPENTNRILLIKLHGIGNIVMLLPAIRALKAHFGVAQIDFLSFDTNEEMLIPIKEIDHCHFIQRTRIWTVLLSILMNIHLIRKRSYDLVIDFEQFAYVSAIISATTGAPGRIGFNNPAHWRNILFTRTVNYTETNHMTHLFSRLTRAAGAPDSPGASRQIPLRDENYRQAKDFLIESGILTDDVVVILHPGSSPNLTLRRWPAESFAALGDGLVKGLGLKVIFSGSDDEISLIGQIRETMKNPTVNAAGRLSLTEFSALVSLSEIVVSNDTATVQIASAMCTPVVGLYGPNTPFLYGPYGSLNDTVFYKELPCSPCLKNTERKVSNCRQALCMELITPDEVYQEIKGKYFGIDGSLIPRFKNDRQQESRNHLVDRQFGANLNRSQNS